MRKIVMGIVILFGLIICGSSLTTKEKPSNSPRANTVMITTLKGNSGGTGVVIDSSPTKSYVLTNRHVCKLAQHMAVVHSPLGGDVPVVSYQVYERHDLCMIVVYANLHAYSTISETAPRDGDKVMVSGHPHLLPRSETFGALSGKHIIPVMEGQRPCTEEDARDPKLAPFCIFFGSLPVVHNYESVSTSAFISPGNSGSQVVNADNKIVGLVFAGSGDPGWGELVPYEYIVDFISELNGMNPPQRQYPDSSFDLTQVL